MTSTRRASRLIWMKRMNSFVSKQFVLHTEIPAICNNMKPGSVEQYWLEKLVSGRLVHGYWDTNVTKESLYQDYLEFCRLRELQPDGFARFDELIFGQLLLDQSTSEQDYRPSTGRLKKPDNPEEEQVAERLEHSVPDLERSRRLYLEARPDLVSHITRMRFTPRAVRRRRFIRLDYLLLFTGIAFLLYQAYLFTLQGTWTSFSILHVMELADWKSGLNWFADTSSLATTKLLGQKLLSYAELPVILLMLGALVYFNTDYD